MSFARPTLRELVQRGQADLNGRLSGADSRLRRSVLGVLVTVFMGAIHGLYGYLDYLARQILPDTAEGDWLVRWAAIFGVSKKPATLAVGSVVATGVNGAVIAAGAVFQRADGVTFATQSDAVIAVGQAVLSVAAQTPGESGASAAGVQLTLVSPIAGVNSQAVVAAGGLTSGADEEDEDQLRERLLERIAEPPMGGAALDYRRWTREVTEVTRAWVFPGWMGAGTVGVAFMMDDRVDPIPTSDDVDVVQARLDELAPVTATVIVFAPIPEPLNLVITGLSPDTAEVRAAIAAEVEDLLFRVASPGGGVPISQLREAVSTAAGEMDHTLTSPTASVTAPAGRLLVLGGITYA